MLTTDKIKLKIKFAAIQCTCSKAATVHYRLSYTTTLKFNKKKNGIIMVSHGMIRTCNKKENQICQVLTYNYPIEH